MKLEERNIDYLINMPLHHQDGNYPIIQRVPGGWIYRYYDEHFEQVPCCVFVPLPANGVI